MRARTHDNFNIILVADGAGLSAERNLIVAGVRGANLVLPNVRLAAAPDPITRERPGRAAPDLVRTELLELRTLVGLHAVDRRRNGVQSSLEDARRARVAKGELHKALVERLINRRGEAAVDGRASLVADIREDDGLGLLGEVRGEVERIRDELAVADGPDGLGSTRSGVQLVVGSHVQHVVLSGHDIVERQGVETSRVGYAAVDVLGECAENFLVDVRGQETKVLCHCQNIWWRDRVRR